MTLSPENEKDDGGPAFACASEWGVGEAPVIQEGMSKRDYIAIAAMQGMISNHELYNEPSFVAETSYGYADAMLAAGQKDSPNG